MRIECQNCGFPEKLVTAQVFSLCENVYEIAQNWLLKHQRGEICPEDSRDMVSLTIAWSEEFDAAHKDVAWGEKLEYFDEIEKFFDQKYTEWLAGLTVNPKNGEPFSNKNPRPCV